MAEKRPPQAPSSAPPSLVKRCRVCSDKALSFNFSGLSCESCKIFFRRHAHKDEEFQCYEGGNCHIDISTRKNCQRCRLDKCIKIGMNKDLIFNRTRSSASSNRTTAATSSSSSSPAGANLNAQSSSPSLSANSSSSNSQLLYEILTSPDEDLLKKEDVPETTVACANKVQCFPFLQTSTSTSQEFKTLQISSIVSFSKKDTPLKVDEDDQTDQTNQTPNPYDTHCLEIIKKVTAIFCEPPPGGINVVGFVDDLADAFNKQEFQIQNLIDLTKCIEGFQALSSADQLVLFKATFPEILFLRSGYFFNFEKNAFLMRVNHNLEAAAYVKLETLYGQSMEQHRVHRKFAFMVRDEIEQDLILRDIVCVLLMFKPNGSIAKPEFIKYQYSLYSHLLRRYLAVKFASNPKRAHDKYAKLMKMVTKIGPMKNDLLPAVTRSVEASQVSHVLNEIYYLRTLSPNHQATCATLLGDHF